MEGRTMNEEERMRQDLVDEIERLQKRVANLERGLAEGERGQEALQAERRFSSSLIHGSPAFFAAMAPKGEIIMMNKSMLSSLGYAVEEVLGVDFLSTFVAPEDKAKFADVFERLTTAHEPTLHEIPVIAKDGSRLLVEWHGRPVFDKEGKFEYFFMTGMDITHRREAERRREETRLLYESMVAAMPLSLLVLDREFNVLMASEECLKECGVDKSGMAGRNVADVLAGPVLSEHALLDRIRRIASSGGRDVLRQVRNVFGGQEEKWFNMYICAISVSGDDEGPRVLLIIEDVTDQRLLAEESLRTQKLELIGKLAGGVAHDFNNLLTGIMGFTDFALETLEEGSQAHRDLTEVRALADRAENLTRQLLAFGRRQMLAPVVLDINSLIEDLIKLLERLIGEDITLYFHPGAELRRVEADPAQIEQVIMNLAVNARDAMPQGGKLIIETTNVTLDTQFGRGWHDFQPGAYVMLAVSDTGRGMDGEIRQHVFEPFFSTKEVGEGTGLGLATTYGIVKQHGGHIRVYSEQGKGTTFKVYLPSTTREETAAGKVRESSVLGGTETILLVEDDDAVRSVAKRALDALGYRVLAVASAEEAEKVFEERGEEIALLVTDVVMPGLNGKELSDRLRARRPGLKVLYMSGYTDNVIVHHGVRASDTFFIQKPLAAHDLARKVRETLDA